MRNSPLSLRGHEKIAGVHAEHLVSADQYYWLVVNMVGSTVSSRTSVLVFGHAKGDRTHPIP